ncbi:MAG: dihydroxy-acid dehydratase, partial [Rhodospirillales bacterium]
MAKKPASKDRGMKKGLTHYGDAGFSLYLRKAFIKAMGYSDDALSRPIVGITDTFSAYNPCHRTVPEIIEAVKRGVMLAGGLPMQFPTISLHESFAHPTSMFLRNLMSMDVEEMIRAQPMDAVVLIGGCDKTVPALLMGAASTNVPAILTVTGPMLTGSHKGERLGACTDCRRLWGMHRAGAIDATEVDQITNSLMPTAGTCGVMGTASTMALMAEALGMMLPGGGAIPAVLADRLRHAEATGGRAVTMAAEGLTPDRIMTAKAFANALRVLLAIGGSTNAIIHLTAVAGRVGVPISLHDLNRWSDETPVLVDLKPSGQHYMEDFFAAGGLGAVLRELRDRLHLECLTVTGEPLGARLEAGDAWVDRGVIRSAREPFQPVGGLVALFGS